MKKSGLLIALGFMALSGTGSGGWFFLPLLVGTVMIWGSVRLYKIYKKR